MAKSSIAKNTSHLYPYHQPTITPLIWDALRDLYFLGAILAQQVEQYIAANENFAKSKCVLSNVEKFNQTAKQLSDFINQQHLQ